MNNLSKLKESFSEFDEETIKENIPSQKVRKMNNQIKTLESKLDIDETIKEISKRNMEK